MTGRDFSSLAGRVVLITGGSGHIGSTLASAFLEHGSAVVTADLMGPPLLSNVDGPHRHLVADVSDLAEVADLPSRVLSAFDRLDVIVLCSSVRRYLGC